MSTQDYSVTLNRQSNGERTTATTRVFSLEVGSKAGDLSVGFNPVETSPAANDKIERVCRIAYNSMDVNA